ncbi:ABC transporter permease [Mesorhizobium sp. L-8-10]|uniref:ABC transporter permease n=1 Tax=Mesorhizobium sp. L-8-10 TaxID=2744523 RepID=UPI001927D7FD|nr:ABC transporter permease [Mesorhizobium sp. L-8-10]BCH29895.1 ABC transporter permease [Mesorhizobium sp. L-8-10]
MAAPNSIALKANVASVQAWRPTGYFWLFLVSVPFLIYLILPILIIVPMALTKGNLLAFPPQWASTRHFTELFQDEVWMRSSWTSLKVALLATVVAAVTGTSAALALYRNNIFGKGFITTVILMPIMIPVVVLALGDYLFLARMGLIGGWMSIGMAHGVLVTPYVFIAVQTSLSGLDPALARAARSLGGGNLALFRHVYWPTLRAGILGGGVFAFIGSFDEVVIALFLAGSSSITLPVQMLTSIQYDLTPKIAAVSSLLFALSILALLTQAFVTKSRSRA